MKKNFSFCIILCLCCLLVSCGKKNPSDSGSGNPVRPVLTNERASPGNTTKAGEAGLNALHTPAVSNAPITLSASYGDTISVIKVSRPEDRKYTISLENEATSEIINLDIDELLVSDTTMYVPLVNIKNKTRLYGSIVHNKSEHVINLQIKSKGNYYRTAHYLDVDDILTGNDKNFDCHIRIISAIHIEIEMDGFYCYL